MVVLVLVGGVEVEVELGAEELELGWFWSELPEAFELDELLLELELLELEEGVVALF